MKKIFIFLLALFTFSFSKSQDCKVETKALQGSYEGDCKKGKADGKGTAKGLDHYTGGFKGGVPEGNGKYTWQNGDWYEGSWKKGMRDGQGEMHYTGNAGKDSLQKGFWKRDKYVGLYEKPYLVHSRTTKMISDDFLKIQADGPNNQLTISAQVTNGPKPILTNVILVNGRYINMTDLDHMSQTSITTFRGVEFPVRMMVYYGSEMIEFEIFEPASWKIELKIQR